MKITRELDLTNFEFWSEAENHNFTYSELKDIQCYLEDIYPEGMEETQVNDLFWFEEEMLCDWIALDYNEYLER